MLNYQRVFFESLTISNHLRAFEPGSIMLWSPSEEYFCTKQSKTSINQLFSMDWFFTKKIDTGKPHDLLMGKSRWSPVKIFPAFWSVRGFDNFRVSVVAWRWRKSSHGKWSFNPSDKHTTVGGLGTCFPWKVGNGIIIPTDELHHFSEGWLKTTNQHIKSYWSRHRKFVDLPMTNGVPCKFTVCYWSHGHRKFVDLPMTNGDFPSCFLYV